MENKTIRNGLNRLKYTMGAEEKCLSKLEIVIKRGILALIVVISLYLLVYKYQFATEKSYYSTVARMVALVLIGVSLLFILSYYGLKEKEKQEQEHLNLSRNRREH